MGGEAAEEFIVVPSPPPPPPRLLVIGNYCHDVLFRDDRVVDNTLGGAAAFVSNVLDALSPSPTSTSTSTYVSKVGPDFAYPTTHPPIVAASTPTTLFHAHFSSSPHAERVLRRVRACAPILPSDLPPSRFDFHYDYGLAVGVAGEITPDTLSAMLDICGVVLVDAQALIRTFDPSDGTVALAPLRDTGFFPLLPRIAFLKASAVEAPFIDVQDARRRCCVLVTDGKDGCTLFWKDGQMRVPSFPAAQELDPTGAGDSFLGAFAAGLAGGLKVRDAALLANFFGSLTVTQIGIPKLHQKLIQKVKQEVERVVSQYPPVVLHARNAELDFHESDIHEEFKAALSEVTKLACCCSGNSHELEDDQG